jgi:hypothetical protein
MDKEQKILFAGKWMELEQNKPSSKSQIWHVFTYVKSGPKMVTIILRTGHERKKGGGICTKTA